MMHAKPEQENLGPALCKSWCCLYKSCKAVAREGQVQHLEKKPEEISYNTRTSTFFLADHCTPQATSDVIFA